MDPQPTPVTPPPADDGQGGDQGGVPPQVPPAEPPTQPEEQPPAQGGDGGDSTPAV